jgi:hypothetical protein
MTLEFRRQDMTTTQLPNKVMKLPTGTTEYDDRTRQPKDWHYQCQPPQFGKHLHNYAQGGLHFLSGVMEPLFEAKIRNIQHVARETTEAANINTLPTQARL